MAATSPYFKSRKRSSPSHNSTFRTRKKKSPQSTKSSYFNRSPLSCFGSINRLGPLIFTLSEKQETTRPCLWREDCQCCKSITNDVLSKFYVCDQFRSQWESREKLHVTTTPLTCWKRADLCVQDCVRHLCQHRCYMRAFAPVREWITLREQVHEQTEIPLDFLFEGWKCKLSSMENDSVVMTGSSDGPPQVSVAFLSPDGTKFSNKTEAAKAILNQNVPVKDVRSLGAPCGDETNTQIADFVESVCDPKATMSVQTETPLGLLEELFCDDPWRLLMSTILLNRTSRVQVDAVYCRFLQQWPTAVEATKADPEEMCNVIRPLGMTNRRCAGIIRFSKEYLELIEAKSKDNCTNKKGTAFNLSEQDILGLFYCGEYASAAYEIFIRRNFLKTNHQDHALTWYVEYQKAKLRGN